MNYAGWWQPWNGGSYTNKKVLIAVAQGSQINAAQAEQQQVAAVWH